VTEPQEMNGFPPADNEMGTCCAFSIFFHINTVLIRSSNSSATSNYPVFLSGACTLNPQLPLQYLIAKVWAHNIWLKACLQWSDRSPKTLRAIPDAFGVNVQSYNTGDLMLVERRRHWKSDTSGFVTVNGSLTWKVLQHAPREHVQPPFLQLK